MDKELIKSGTILVDFAHTNAAVRAKSPTQILRGLSKQLRKEIYKKAYDLSELFSEKPFPEAGLDEEIAYTKELFYVLEEGIAAWGDKKIQNREERIQELLDTERSGKSGQKMTEKSGLRHPPETVSGFGEKR